MKINVRQICFIMLAYTVVSKLLIYPTVLSGFCGRDLLFAAIVDLLVEGIVVWSVAYLSSRTDKTFFELLENTIGNIGARIVYGFFAAFFMLAAIIPLFEQKLYVHTIFYDTVPSVIVFLPIFIFTVYAASKRFANIGRCADVCLPIFAVTMGALLIMSYGEAEWSNLLPMFQTPALDIFRGAAGTLFRFVSPCWLLMFLGYFKYEKGAAAKITLSYAGGAAIVLLFLTVFYGIYGDISSSRTFAISRTSIFFPAIETIGRIDLILLYALEIVMLFALALNVQLAVHAVSKCSGYGELNIISLGVNAVLAVIVIVCDHYFHAMQEVFFNWMWIVFVLFAIIIPVLAWALRRRNANERQN